MKKMVVVLASIVAIMLVGLTGYSALRDNVATAVNDCASSRTMLNEEIAAQKAAINPLGGYDAEVRAVDLQKALDACNGKTKTEESAAPTPSAPSPTATVKVTATATPTTDARYACRPTFYNDEPGSLGSYTFGKPVSQTDLNGVVQELRDRVWCDPALLVQKAREYKVLALDANQAHDLATELMTQARNGQQTEWDALYEQFIVRLAASQNSLGVLPAGTYTSYVMLRGSSSEVPYVATVSVYRSGGDATLVSILPDGTKLAEQRVACGYQMQTVVVVVWAKVPTLRDIPRANEGAPVKFLGSTTMATATVTKPGSTTTATATATATTTATATATATTTATTTTTSTPLPSKASATPAKTNGSPTPSDPISSQSAPPPAKTDPLKTTN